MLNRCFTLLLCCHEISNFDCNFENLFMKCAIALCEAVKRPSLCYFIQCYSRKIKTCRERLETLQWHKIFLQDFRPSHQELKSYFAAPYTPPCMPRPWMFTFWFKNIYRYSTVSNLKGIPIDWTHPAKSRNHQFYSRHSVRTWTHRLYLVTVRHDAWKFLAPQWYMHPVEQLPCKSV